MAVVPIQAESTPANPSEFIKLWRAWRHVKAEWEMAENAPDLPAGLPQDASNAFCDREEHALLAMLLHPAGKLEDVAMKLRAFKTEAVYDATNVQEVLDRLLKDVRRFAYGFE